MERYRKKIIVGNKAERARDSEKAMHE